MLPWPVAEPLAEAREEPDTQDELLAPHAVAEAREETRWLSGYWVAVVWRNKEDEKVWYVGRVMEDVEEGEVEFLVDYLRGNFMEIKCQKEMI